MKGITSGDVIIIAQSKFSAATIASRMIPTLVRPLKQGYS
jgi:hypothetical protein